MADILIPNMRKPTSCHICPLASPNVNEQYWLCHLTFKWTEKGNLSQKCPLIEIPPHGRLIDADALSNRLLGEGIGNLLIHRKQRLTVGDVRTIIENAPTVLEANNG